MGEYQSFTMPPPTGGLNVTDSIDSMDPSEALEQVNILPTGIGGRVRYGYTSFSNTGSSQIKYGGTLPLQDGTTQLIGASGAKLTWYKSGSVTDVTGATVPTSAEWQGDIFANKLYICNGTDKAQYYAGSSTFADITFTGVTLANLINVSSYKERLYFIEKATLKVWYGNTKATGSSALNSYDFQYAFSRGGYLLFAGSWSNQVGVVTDDLFMLCSSEGEIIFYSGSSPDSGSWGITARYFIGKPLGYRSFIKVNNDIWIITDQGIVPVSALFTMDPSAALKTVGRKVNPIISQYASSMGFSHLWHGAYWPQGRLIFIVVPVSGTQTRTLVYSIDANGWCIYETQNLTDSVQITVSGSSVYYGNTTGTMFTAETGYSDNGSLINFNGRMAFSFYGDRGRFKAFKDIRPLMRSRAGITLQLGLDTNFQKGNNIDTISTGESSGSFIAWGSAWGSAWSTEDEYFFNRHTIKGQGHSAAIRIAGSIKDAPLEFYGFEVRLISGAQV